jgi:zinc protease
VAARTVASPTPQAYVLDGFFGPDVSDVANVRRFTMAARLLSTRLSAEIRERLQLVYSIRAAFQPGTDRPGFGTFAAQAPTDPAKAKALGEALEAQFSLFAKEGPTDEELAVAKRQTANTLDEALRSPDWWTERLQDLDYRGLSLDDVLSAPDAYRAMTKEEVRDAFARWYVPAGRLRVTVTPETPVVPAAPEPPAKSPEEPK